MGTLGAMASIIPETHKDLLERPLIAHLATIRPDGTPQNNPVWFEWDGREVKISHTKARQKFRNVQAHPTAALSIVDPDDPYRYLEVRAEVAGIDDDPERAFIDHLSHLYMGQPYPFHQPGDERVIIRLRPTGTSAMG